MTWAEKSYRVARATLAALPKDTAEEDCSKALSAAYPFGEKAMHPYKEWRKVVTECLIIRFPRGKSALRRFQKADRKSGLAPLPAQTVKTLFGEGTL